MSINLSKELTKALAVSVIMPLYNGERYVAAAIEGVLNQSHRNIELIIIDDGSSDASVEVVSRYLSDPRVILIENPKNIGVARSRNLGLDMSSGNYISFCDSDDVWRVEKISSQLDVIRAKKCKVVATWARVIDSESAPVGKVRKAPSVITLEMLRSRNFVTMSSALHEKPNKNIRFESVHHEDFCYWYKIIAELGSAMVIDRLLIDYRQHDKSITSNKLRSFIWTCKILWDFNNHNIIKTARAISFNLMSRY